jgi:hypothetical protein
VTNVSKVEVRLECDKMENSNKGPKVECREMTEEETGISSLSRSCLLWSQSLSVDDRV